MPWILVDLAVGLLALVALGVTVFVLYRRVRSLGRVVSTASERVSEVTGELEALQSEAAARRTGS